MSTFLNNILAKDTIGQRPRKVLPISLFLTGIGCFLGLIAVGLIDSVQNTAAITFHPMIIGSFGATAVLVYGAVDSPLAQPTCVIGGNVLSALVGVSISKIVCLIPSEYEQAACLIGPALAVAISTVLMQMTRTLHPPGGATALIAVIGDSSIKSLGYFYVLNPVLLGSCVLLFVAAMVGNLSSVQSYPQYWLYPNDIPASSNVGNDNVDTKPFVHVVQISDDTSVDSAII